MTIERFDCGTHYDGGVMLDSDDGEYVYHKDYSALEAKCAALAAELKQSQIDAGCYKHGMEASNARLAQLAADNAALKSAVEFATAPDMWEDMGGNVMRYQYKEWYADKLKYAMQFPATDAFLAEVRAQGADECVRQLVISDDDDFSDAPNVCAMVAHQLRQEAAQ